MGPTVQIEAKAKDEIANLIRIDAGFREHAARLAFIEQQIIRPFEAGFELGEIFDEPAKIQAHPEREILEARRRDFWAKNEGAIKIARRRTVPSAAPAPAPLSLGLRENHQGCRATIRELPLSLTIGAINAL